MTVYKNDKVLLAKFTSSEQMMADNAGKSTSALGDFYREKTYVKPDDMINPHYPPFPEPYKFGQFLFGGDWNEYNKPFIIQVAQCNIDCWYCFVDKKLREGKEDIDGCKVGDWFTAEEVIDMWRHSGRNKVLRISGGEPTLASGFLMDMVKLVADEECLLWIDTNLSTGNHLFNAIDKRTDMFGGSNDYGVFEYGWNVGVCGCFKGFTDKQASDTTGADRGLLDRQIEMARRLIDDTLFEPFFYVPGIVEKNKNLGEIKDDISNLFHRLRHEVHENAPLRTHVLEIKNYSSTIIKEWDNYIGVLPYADLHTGKTLRPIDIWQELCRETYPPELLWLPDIQVSLGG